MKLTKQLKTVFLLGLFSILISLNVEAMGPKPGSQKPWKPWKKDSPQTVVQPSNPGNGNAVGVPLDGGLLALLAGAGITYFAARRKKKKEMQ